jgi:hypothetical protein
MRLLAVIGLLAAVLSTRGAPHANAALYWFQGVQTNPISVCFVGDAVTSRPARVEQILTYLQEFTYAANIQFDYWGTCPPAVLLPDLRHFYGGDIRVVIPSVSVSGTGPVPGNGCPLFNQTGPGGYDGGNDGWGSWSNSPNDLGINYSCMYNLKLGDNPWGGTPYLNHTLHEFGHALGLSHEHVRMDATCYDPADDARSTDQGYMTPYDKYSVMHYVFETAAGHTCDTPGNYAYTGLTEWDKLALHILYPEEVRVAEFVGTTVLRTGETLHLQSAWQARGANMPFVAKDFQWTVDGTTYSTGPQLWLALNEVKDYVLEFSHRDFLDRDYTYTGVVRVLDDDDFDEQIVAPVAASLPLIYPNHFMFDSGGKLDLAPWLSFSAASGTFEDTVVIDFAAESPGNTGNLPNVGRFYNLKATYLSNGQPANVAEGQTYSVTVTYEQGNVPPSVGEGNLALYSWTNSAGWVKEETSAVDTLANTVTATPNHFSSWAILGKVRVYLPMVVRSAGAH